MEFDIKNKKIITLNVSDSPSDYPEEAQKLAILSPMKFQEKYVYKELRKQLFPYMQKFNI
ncbi:MAG: hypothetical protein ACQER9_01360 [Nanobdellota archaeon]